MEFYRSTIRKAQEILGEGDRDAAHLLGLALKLKCPIWSNDKDFEGSGVSVYTTLDLVKRLG